MEDWLLITLTVSLLTLVYLLFNTTTTNKKRKLPPGPPTLLENLTWIRTSMFDLAPALRQLQSIYGPIFTISIGFRPLIFITDRDLAHKILIRNGAAFANRPPSLEPNPAIISSPYGPRWRLLRRNLAFEVLQPSRLRSHSNSRKWVLRYLADDLRNQANARGGLCVPVESFRHAMFRLLVLICFGGNVGESVIRDIEEIEGELILHIAKLNVFRSMPGLMKLIFRKRWQKFMQIRRRQEEIYSPLIRARKQSTNNDAAFNYVDSLLQLKLTPEEGGRGLTEREMVHLCSELLFAGTDSTSTALQWIMANVVKYPHVQKKILEEVIRVGGDETEEVKEEDIQRMPYVKAVVLEGLRRHPPAHFLVPHTVSEEVSVDGYIIPKNATFYVTLAEIGWDEKVWKEPMEFRPERFLVNGDEGAEATATAVDITGSREIKMMPFGVGRRICPGMGLALLHLEYFVANLVRDFEWKAVEDEEIDLSEKVEMTVVMKNPLRAKIVPRARVVAQ
ncbi:Cytochrome P450 89A9 [Acorus gramineus]|uniref:Cytochrome P450 89A9 n=1 Tax=Acorus gramineus TaxID=55184 RepID=A0AAV9BCW1_ACOGR|nr:Cytochrome P450 89A9 [Acorus gramineus]